MDGGQQPSMELQLAQARLEAAQHEYSAATLTMALMQYRIPELKGIITRLQDEVKALGGMNGTASN